MKCFVHSQSQRKWSNSFHFSRHIFVSVLISNTSSRGTFQPSTLDLKIQTGNSLTKNKSKDLLFFYTGIEYSLLPRFGGKRSNEWKNSKTENHLESQCGGKEHVLLQHMPLHRVFAIGFPGFFPVFAALCSSAHRLLFLLITKLCFPFRT